MTPSQHAKVLEALEIAVRQSSHDMLMTGEEIRACESALSIMRAAKPVTYGRFYGCAYCQGGAGMGGDGYHSDANGLRVRCPNFIDFGDISAPPTEHEVKP